MSGTLYVVATPIGHLADITFRAVEVLKNVAVIAAEDTRVTRKLLNHYHIETELVSYREQNARTQVPRLIRRLLAGEDVAQVSDAGTPSISDPGVELVASAHKNGILVSPIPGPSALTAAVSVGAIIGDGIRFAGFLPKKGKERKQRLNQMITDNAAIVLYESPNRIHKTLCDLNDVLGPRPVLVARELTKQYETIVRTTLDLARTQFESPQKGEFTLVVAGPDKPADDVLDDVLLERAVQEAITRTPSARGVTEELSLQLGVKKKRIYQMALKLLTTQNNK